MWLHSLLLLSMALAGLSQLLPWSETPPAPQCTLTYTPYMTPQIGPTTTIYGAIMTTYFYCVDCTHCTVTNAQNNAVHQGPFTAKTTSPMLTITRVECIPEATSITRRHEEIAGNAPHTAEVDDLQRLRGSNIVRRSGDVSLADFASTFTFDIPPDSQLLSGPAKKQLSAILTAIFALNVADSGMDVKSACAQVQTSDVRYQLLESGFDPDQCKALLCWIADNGYDFDTTRAQLFSSLEAAVYGLFLGSDYTTNRTQVCENLGLFNSVGGYLGIDTQAYHDLVCTNLPSETPTPSIWYGPTPIIPYITDGMTTWGPPSTWLPNTTIAGTGLSTWYGNVTTVGPPISYTGTIGTDWSMTSGSQTNWTQPEPTAGPAASDSPTGASNETGLAAHRPRGRNEAAFYPAIPTTTQRHGLFKRY